MNFIWLEDFLVLAASGNFSRAADERHVTQPAFSRRIRALEEWLGVELFDRGTQPARLTESGEWFRQQAEELLARVARIPGEARAVADAGSATLRLAATHALSFTFLPGWLRGLEAHTAVGPINLVSDMMQRCETLLLQSQVQFALCHAHPKAPGALDVPAVESVQVGEDVLVPVCAPDGKRPRFSLDAKKGPVPVLGYGAESGIGRILQATQAQALARLGAKVVFTAHLASVLKTMALDGRGIAWLPQSLAGEELAAGRLVTAGAQPWNVTLEIRLYRAPGPLGPAALAFWKAAKVSSKNGR